MKINKISDMKGGWFVGGFFPTVHDTDEFEVGYKLHKKNSDWDTHYHTDVKEINFIVRGKMRIQNTILETGDIFTLYPFEIADPVFLEDTEIVCVKTPSMNDKICVKKI
jgi:mannose-6-phosphate isomerase-like protein (cupin superfamily)